MDKSGQSRGRLKAVRGFISELYGHDLHAKRVEALAGATLGVMTRASLAVAVIGQALAQAPERNEIDQPYRAISSSFWAEACLGERMRRSLSAPL